MANPTTVTINCETGENVEREMNAQELANYNTLKKNVDAEMKSRAQAATDKAALLAKLGITADEAKLLLS